MGLMMSVLVFSVGVLEALSCLEHIRQSYLPLELRRRRRRLVLDVGTGSIRHRETRRSSEIQRDTGFLLRRLSKSFLRDDSQDCEEIIAILESIERNNVHSSQITQVQDPSLLSVNDKTEGEGSTEVSRSSTPATIILNSEAGEEDISTEIDIPLDDKFCKKCVDEQFDILSNLPADDVDVELGIEGSCVKHNVVSEKPHEKLKSEIIKYHNKKLSKQRAIIKSDDVPQKDISVIDVRCQQSAKDSQLKETVAVCLDDNTVPPNSLSNAHGSETEHCLAISTENRAVLRDDIGLITRTGGQKMEQLGELLASNQSSRSLLEMASARKEIEASGSSTEMELTSANEAKVEINYETEKNGGVEPEEHIDTENIDHEVFLDENVCKKCIDEKFELLTESTGIENDMPLGIEGSCKIHDSHVIPDVEWHEISLNEPELCTLENVSAILPKELSSVDSSEGNVALNMQEEIVIPSHGGLAVIKLPNENTGSNGSISEIKLSANVPKVERAEATERTDGDELKENLSIETANQEMHLDENYCKKCIDERFELLADSSEVECVADLGVEGFCKIHDSPDKGHLQKPGNEPDPCNVVSDKLIEDGQFVSSNEDKIAPDSQNELPSSASAKKDAQVSGTTVMTANDTITKKIEANENSIIAEPEQPINMETVDQENRQDERISNKCINVSAESIKTEHGADLEVEGLPNNQGSPVLQNKKDLEVPIAEMDHTKDDVALIEESSSIINTECNTSPASRKGLLTDGNSISVNQQCSSSPDQVEEHKTVSEEEVGQKTSNKSSHPMKEEKPLQKQLEKVHETSIEQVKEPESVKEESIPVSSVESKAVLSQESNEGKQAEIFQQHGVTRVGSDEQGINNGSSEIVAMKEEKTTEDSGPIDIARTLPESEVISLTVSSGAAPDNNIFGKTCENFKPDSKEKPSIDVEEQDLHKVQDERNSLQPLNIVLDVPDSSSGALSDPVEDISSLQEVKPLQQLKSINDPSIVEEPELVKEESIPVSSVESKTVAPQESNEEEHAEIFQQHGVSAVESNELGVNNSGKEIITVKGEKLTEDSELIEIARALPESELEGSSGAASDNNIPGKTHENFELGSNEKPSKDVEELDISKEQDVRNSLQPLNVVNATPDSSSDGLATSLKVTNETILRRSNEVEISPNTIITNDVCSKSENAFPQSGNKTIEPYTSKDANALTVDCLSVENDSPQNKQPDENNKAFVLVDCKPEIRNEDSKIIAQNENNSLLEIKRAASDDQNENIIQSEIVESSCTEGNLPEPNQVGLTKEKSAANELSIGSNSVEGQIDRGEKSSAKCEEHDVNTEMKNINFESENKTEESSVFQELVMKTKQEPPKELLGKENDDFKKPGAVAKTDGDEIFTLAEEGSDTSMKLQNLGSSINTENSDDGFESACEDIVDIAAFRALESSKRGSKNTLEDLVKEGKGLSDILQAKESLKPVPKEEGEETGAKNVDGEGGDVAQSEPGGNLQGPGGSGRRVKQKVHKLTSLDDDDVTLVVESTPKKPNFRPVQDISSPDKAFWLIFSGEYTKAMDKDWHSGHFCCWQCDESLTGQRYVLRDDHPYCIKCYEQVFANTCDECSKVIGIDSKDLSYKDKHWHEACFLCSKCRVSLVDKQFGSKADKIYCGNCYDAQFASRCDGCSQIFRAGTKKMEYKTRQWHEQCFCCCVCKSAIGTKSFIPREQEIYCAGCYEEKFATRCVKCNKIITSGGVTYKNEPWHRECFTCTNCSTSLAGQRFTSRDEKPYCAECFGELFAKRCTACCKPITGIGGTRFISFEDRHWHNDCFICASCKSSLVGRGFITDGEDILCTECAKQKLM